MLKFFFKLLGLLALALMVITAILDLTRSIADSQVVMTALGQQWLDFHVASLNGFQVGIQRKLGIPWIWDTVIVNILLLPSWLVFAVFAAIFLWLGRKKRGNWQKRFGR